MQTSARNSYIDLIKFVFAISIALFHLGNHYLAGGRVAVEGFFMISGYLMMKSIEREKGDGLSLGKATVRFMKRKYGTLLHFLIPSILLGMVATIIMEHRPFPEVIERLPLRLFDVFPMSALGNGGGDAVGISWYLSSMLFALSVLYPLCKKYGENFVLCAGIPVCLLIYGYLHRVFGHLAVTTFIDGTNIPAGLLRGLAGCLAGCVLYYWTDQLGRVRLTSAGKKWVIVLETLGYAYALYAVRHHAQSQYDYVLIFLLFGLLGVGISGITGLSALYSHPRTKALGTISTLIVLNHVPWNKLLKYLYGAKYGRTPHVWLYPVCVIAACCVAYGLARLGAMIKNKLPSMRLDPPEEENFTLVRHMEKRG